MTLHQLHCFQVLARVENYHRAAERLYLSQPSLSRCISQLETELGVKFFRKEGRHVVLTEAGRVFQGHVDRILSDVDVAVSVMQAFAAGEEKMISIGCISPAVSTYLSPMLRSWRQEQEDFVQYRTWVGMSEELVERLVSGQCDVIFSSRVAEAVEVNFTPVYEAPFYAIVRRDDPLAALSSVSMQQLDGRAMLFTAAATYSTLIRDIMDEGHIRYVASGCSNEETSLIGMVEAGLGILITTDYPQIRSSGTVPVILENGQLMRRVYMGTLSRKDSSPAVRRFVEFNRKYAAWERKQPAG